MFSGGVFIVIFVGIAMACITLAFEYWWMRYKKPKQEESDDQISKIFEHRRNLADQMKIASLSNASFPDKTSTRDNVPYRYATKILFSLKYPSILC